MAITADRERLESLWDDLETSYYELLEDLDAIEDAQEELEDEGLDEEDIEAWEGELEEASERAAASQRALIRVCRQAIDLLSF